MKDGTRIQEIADGTVISTAPDGTKTQVRVSSVREGGGARMRVWLGLRTILLEGGRCGCETERWLRNGSGALGLKRRGGVLVDGVDGI